MKRLWLAVLLALAACLVPATAHAQDAAEKLAGKKLLRRQAELSSYKGWASMTVGWRDAVNAKIRRKLLSGLPTVIVARAYVFAEDEEQPISLSVQTCRVVFDLWDEVFRIELREGGKKKKTVAVNVEGVMRRCAEARRMPLASMTALEPTTRYFVGVLVEVNPLSKEMMDRIKRWVSRPRGAGAVGPGDSLFGSFVGLFVTHVPDADRVITFRTQSFAPASLPLVIEPEAEKRSYFDEGDDDLDRALRTREPPPPTRPAPTVPPSTRDRALPRPNEDVPFGTRVPVSRNDERVSPGGVRRPRPARGGRGG
jgi:hypothetical protein